MIWKLDALKILAKNSSVPGVALKDACGEIEKLYKVRNEARETIKNLLCVLPDSHTQDESWDWAWNELSGDGQDLVKEKRKLAVMWLNANPEEAG